MIVSKGRFFSLISLMLANLGLLILCPAVMQEILLVLLCILLCADICLHQESCMYKVAFLQNKNVSCFSKMGQTEACSKKHPNCRSEERNGMACYKFATNFELVCFDNNLNKVSIENQTCGKDQESLDCTKEFPNTLTPVVKASAVTIYCEGGFFHLLLIICGFLFIYLN